MNTPRSTVRRMPARARYDAETVHAILDEALIVHVGFVQDGQPFVIPTLHARRGDTLFLHGAVASRMLKTLAEGLPVCATATLVDGLVFARSAFHHSMNYRSVVVFGVARLVTDAEEKRAALDALVEHVAKGRSAEVRAPNPKELGATSVLALAIDEASAKVRTGGPIDDAEDHDLPVWAGVLPLSLTAASPLDDTTVPPGAAASAVVSQWRRPTRV